MQVDILGSVDQCHTEDEIALQRRDLVLSTPRVFVHAPGALPEHQDCLAGWELDGADGSCRHAKPLSLPRQGDGVFFSWFVKA